MTDYKPEVLARMLHDVGVTDPNELLVTIMHGPMVIRDEGRWLLIWPRDCDTNIPWTTVADELDALKGVDLIGCLDCHADVEDEKYMVHNELWAAAGMGYNGYLCIGCIEKRLGRQLEPSDFCDVLLHTDERPRSERLQARLQGR